MSLGFVIRERARMQNIDVRDRLVNGHVAFAGDAVTLEHAAPAWTKPRATGAERAIKSLDSDNDGTLDLAEVKTTASALFDRLDKDRDGTLTIKELQGRLNRK